LAQFEPAGELDQAVGKRRLAVVDMRDDGEIADILDRDRRHARQITPGVAAFKHAGSNRSFPRKRESSLTLLILNKCFSWVPACAGTSGRGIRDSHEIAFRHRPPARSAERSG